MESAADLARLLRRHRQELRRVSRAGVETMAIIAYRESAGARRSPARSIDRASSLLDAETAVEKSGEDA